MENKGLQDHISNLLQAIESNLLAYAKDPKPNHLHRIRVSIKKIKALLSFATHTYQEPYTTNQLDSLFDAAGQLRELQINSIVLGKFTNPPVVLLAELQAKEKRLTEEFTANCPNYSKVVKLLQETITMPDKLPSKKSIKDYFKISQKKAAEKWEQKERSSLHRYRIKIKKLMYAFSALPEPIQKEIDFPEAEYQKQQRKLGVWHDITLALAFLSEQPLEGIGRDVLVKLQEKEERKFHRLFGDSAEAKTKGK